MEKDSFDMFPLLAKFIVENNILSLQIGEIICAHLIQLIAKFYHYFGNSLISTDEYDWLINPFLVEQSSLSFLPLGVAEQFIDATNEPANPVFLNRWAMAH